ncbi:MAG: aminoacyl-tRNA hydrolase [Malacoplasma sp.]
MNKFLIVGLGNPGYEYVNTKHNVGFSCIDYLSNKLNLKLDKEKFNGLYTKTNLNNVDVFFAKPQTYMNLSGDFVKKFVDYFDIPTDNILVIYDDIYLPLATYRLKISGSSAGQKGLQDIITKLNTTNIKRLKIGIGLPKEYVDKISVYVLSKFNYEEKEVINNLYSILYNIINDFTLLSFPNLMNKYNKK